MHIRSSLVLAHPINERLFRKAFELLLFCYEQHKAGEHKVSGDDTAKTRKLKGITFTAIVA